MAAVLVDGPSLPFASIESVLFRGTVSKVQQNIIYNPPSSCYLILISYVLLTLFRKPATRRFPEALWYHEHLRPAVLTSSVQARVAWRVQRVVVGTFLSSSLVHCISLACVPHLPLRWKGPGCATRCPSQRSSEWRHACCSCCCRRHRCCCCDLFLSIRRRRGGL